ncbi:hypothetical protein [Rugosimonospora africana]|uniref:Uncharacterized protein n=1 Tax=Rugosimonospora africana TaxID=556532 RepID=A0A8J3VWX2_9ACTN|nr:hypothetical protein [Rugosimonospora africana]GIH21324.1 hypothetical protein Raf01_94960 [Rugosimonospora africana]
MTRPDYDGTRYGGQGGVIGAQQYGNRQAANQQQPNQQQAGGQQPGDQQQYGGQQYAAQTAPPGAQAAQQYAAQATPPGAHAGPDPQQAPGQRQAPAGHPGYNSYLPPGTYRAAAAAPLIAPGAQQPAAQPPMGQAPMGQAAVAQPPMAAPPVAQPVAPPPVLGGPALAQQPPAIATSTGVATAGVPATPAGVAAPSAGLANEPAGLVNPVSRAAQRAAATTTSTALATGAAASRSAATAAASTPDIPHHGTVYGGRRPADGGEPVFSGTQPRLHIGWHSASLSALEMIGVSSPGTGLILGADVDQRPVPVRFFRPEPTRITLVGGVWAAQMVAFRALAFGANAVVLTGDPAAWHGFGEHATGRSDRVAVLHGERPVNTQGSPQQPVLVIHDLGVVGPTTAVDLGPWQTQLTVLRQLDERGVPALQEGQLVMMQRLAFGEATLAATALRLTGESAQLLQQMEDEMLALIGGGADRYVWISPTSVERRQGPARR